MHRLIAERAGHRAIAEAMRYADHSSVSWSGWRRSDGPRPAGRR